MEGKFQSVEEVFISIKFLLQQASINLSNKKPWTSQDEHILHMIEFPWTPVKVKQIRVVSWTKPIHNRIKLNVDGSSLGNLGQAGRGGVVQNDKGELISAFNIFFREATNNEVELRALIESLKICREPKLYHIDIKCTTIKAGFYCIHLRRASTTCRKNRFITACTKSTSLKFTQ